MPKRQALFLSLTAIFLAGVALASGAIPNWRAPATWSPTRSHGLTAQDVTNPLPFIGLAPCRIVDTRGGAPITGGIFTGGADVRNYAVAGICGIPIAARALSLNFTITGPGQTTAGFLLAWPTGGAVPPVSILNWDHVQAQIANAAVVPTDASVSFTVNVSAPTHVIIDVNGYYPDGSASLLLAPGERFEVAGSLGPPYGILNGRNNSTATDARAVFGISDDAASITRTFSAAAGRFESFTGTGVLGLSNGGGSLCGVFGGKYDTAGNEVALGCLGIATTGIFGISEPMAGTTYGIQGTQGSLGIGSAGILGYDASGRVVGSTTVLSSAGVRGESTLNFGVLGLTTSTTGVAGTAGYLRTTAGGTVAIGYLGSLVGTAADVTGPPWGVFAMGNLGASGAKHFVEPHPADPNGVILYSSLEGREVGTYFRGTARTVGGIAAIQVPEDFRIVTDDEGLTTQLTPVGSAATMYIVSEDLNTIVVRSSRDVTFHYLIQGVRRAFKDFQPIMKGYEFMPSSADDRIPAYLTEEAKQRLVANGTYNADGTVNMATAERAGWTKIWADRLAAAEAARVAAAQQRIEMAGSNKQ